MYHLEVITAASGAQPGTQLLGAPGVDKTLVVHAIGWNFDADVHVYVAHGSTRLTGQFCAGKGGRVPYFRPDGQPLWADDIIPANTALTYTTDAAANGYIEVFYDTRT